MVNNMGCLQSKKEKDEMLVFKGLKMTRTLRCKLHTCFSIMEKNNIPYRDTWGILLCMKNTKVWNIYFHFTNWKVPISAQLIDNLKNDFVKATDMWLSKLKTYNSFPSSIKVNIFGFVFNKGVLVDDSFKECYGEYPTVTDWPYDNEQCPWIFEYDGKRYTSVNYYEKTLNLSKSKVVSNKTTSGAKFHPGEWSNYVHPEGIYYFQTKFWHGTQWKAHAQRQYIRIGGVVQNPSTGNLGDNFPVLLHEMGHCFFLDDMYDARKFPSSVVEKQCGVPLNRNDTVMFGNRTLTIMDHAMLREVYDKQLEFQST